MGKNELIFLLEDINMQASENYCLLLGFIKKNILDFIKWWHNRFHTTMFWWTEKYDPKYQYVLSMAQMKGLCIYFIEKKLCGPKNNTFRVIAQSQKGEKCSLMSIFVGDLSLRNTRIFPHFSRNFVFFCENPRFWPLPACIPEFNYI